jgi:hypothetical protein
MAAKKPTSSRKRPATKSRKAPQRRVARTTAAGKYVANVPPPAKQLDRYTRWWQAIFFFPFLLIEFWFAWSLFLVVFTRCSSPDLYSATYWCEPRGKLYVTLMLIMVLSLLALGLFAARLAFRQGIRWKFLLLYTGLVLIGQFMLWRAIVWVLF